MKIALYGICKNEVALVKRFAESIRGKADLVCFSDTGSTDGTQDAMRSYGFEVHDIKVEPFRFDVARNLSLSKLPDDVDIAVCPDLDDVFHEDWREIIEANWVEGKTRFMNYPYINNWDSEDGHIPILSILGFKIHDPKYFEWLQPIHEYLEVKPGMQIPIESIVKVNNHIFEHRPVYKEDRGGRLTIFEDALRGDKKDDMRLLYLYGRELFVLRRFEECIKVLLRYLDKTKPYEVEEAITFQRSSSCRMIATSLIVLDKSPNDIITWLIRGVGENPGQRESWIYLADAWYFLGNGIQAYSAVKTGASIQYKANSLEVEELCWDPERTKTLLDKSKELMLKQLNQYSNDIEGWTSNGELTCLYETAKLYRSIVEIGSWKGRSTHALLSGCKGKVYAVDHFKGTDSDGDAHKEAKINSDGVYKQFIANTKDVGNLKVLRMSSQEASLQFKDKSVDMVFIDAGHTYEEVKKDIELWKNKAKKIICGHDYNFPGVKQAADEAFGIKNMKLKETIWYHLLKK